MAGYAINAEGAASMRALAKQLYTEANSVLESSAALEARIFAVEDGLGEYAPQIKEIVQQCRSSLKSNRDDILGLAQRVRKQADMIDELVFQGLAGVASEDWMNNFNADVCRRQLPDDKLNERLELYRNGVAAVIGDEAAASLSSDDLEQLSRVRNRAYSSGLQLSDGEIAELYKNAVGHVGNFVTRQIEYKMDMALQAKAHGFLQTKYSKNTWNALSIGEKKDALNNLLIDLNSLFGTDISTEIEFYHKEATGERGCYSDSSKCVKINEYLLIDKDTSYELVQTMIHEMRHAYQHYAIRNSKNVLVSSQTIKAWEDNFSNYALPEKGNYDKYVAYVTQPVEWDAKNFAKQISDVSGHIPKYEGSWGKEVTAC